MFDLLWLQTFPGLEECMQSRPPLQLDLTGPKPTTYDPPTTLPWETSSPSYTMRPKTQPERGKATTIHMLSDKYGEQGMAQWWEHSPLYRRGNESAAHALFIEDEFVLSFFEKQVLDVEVPWQLNNSQWDSEFSFLVLTTQLEILTRRIISNIKVLLAHRFFTKFIYLQIKVVTELLGANSGLPVQISGHTELTLIVG